MDKNDCPNITKAKNHYLTCISTVSVLKELVVTLLTECVWSGTGLNITPALIDGQVGLAQ